MVANPFLALFAEARHGNGDVSSIVLAFKMSPAIPELNELRLGYELPSRIGPVAILCCLPGLFGRFPSGFGQFLQFVFIAFEYENSYLSIKKASFDREPPSGRYRGQVEG